MAIQYLLYVNPLHDLETVPYKGYGGSLVFDLDIVYLHPHRLPSLACELGTVPYNE